MKADLSVKILCVVNFVWMISITGAMWKLTREYDKLETYVLKAHSQFAKQSEIQHKSTELLYQWAINHEEQLRGPELARRYAEASK